MKGGASVRMCHRCSRQEVGHRNGNWGRAYAMIAVCARCRGQTAAGMATVPCIVQSKHVLAFVISNQKAASRALAEHALNRTPTGGSMPGRRSSMALHTSCLLSSQRNVFIAASPYEIQR